MTMIHIILPECSRIAGRKIDRCCNILDIKGLGLMKLMDSETKRYLGISMQVAQDYFPELMLKTFVVNAGWLFTGVWAIAKAFLDKKTKKKVSIEGSGFKKKLLEFIDEDQLPLWLGGTNKREMHEQEALPWHDYLQQCKTNGSYFSDGVIQGNPHKEPARKIIKDEEERLLAIK